MQFYQILAKTLVYSTQPHDCLLNRLFRRRSKKTSKLRVTGLCAGNSPGTDEFPAQMASNVENVSIWWGHHGNWKNDSAIALSISLLLYPYPVRKKQIDCTIAKCTLFMSVCLRASVFIFLPELSTYSEWHASFHLMDHCVILYFWTLKPTLCKHINCTL